MHHPGAKRAAGMRSVAVIPDDANGSRECAPDDRLRGDPESRDSGPGANAPSRNDDDTARSLALAVVAV